VQESGCVAQNTVPRFSVVIPTYQRRDVVLRSVRSLAGQEFNGSFEVIVVVDGSTDGTAEALRTLNLPFPITVLEQPNRGAASARNRGATNAQGELLLFLDDDMEAHPRLLTEHDGSHRDGADAVLGHIPLHPESPSNIVTNAVKSWADRRGQRLSSPGAKLTLHDFLTGQLSLPRETFYRMGGFDTQFTHGGSFGNEDLDFGYRLLGNHQIVFNPNAISWQYYIVQPRQHLRQRRQAGHADVKFVRKHPDAAGIIFAATGKRRIDRHMWRPIAALPLLADPLIRMLRWLVLAIIERGALDSIAMRLFFEIRTLEYLRGVKQAGDIPRARPLRVLAYHAIADLSGAAVLEPYGVPPDVFRRQMDTLLQAGFRFIDANEFLRFLHGRGGLPRKALLLTFDDCYEELPDVVLPILEERGIPAVAFAVTGRLGGTNDWDKGIGGLQRRLVDADGLRKLAERGIEIGAHSRTHRALTRVPIGELAQEIAGSVADLETRGFARPRLFSYPHGQCNHSVQQAVKEAGLQAAFTVDSGHVQSGQDPYRVSRIEIMKDDVGWKLRRKIALPMRSLTLSKSLRLQLQRLRSCLQE
jgi:glycosyltransferase involved in cell wall biosynthesis/peptidoglycan/xylan/chitin deacetylase (PgdA/CDA1 family)